MNDAKPQVMVIGCDPRPEIQSCIAAICCVPTVGSAREVETNRDIYAVVVATPAPTSPLATAAHSAPIR